MTAAIFGLLGVIVGGALNVAAAEWQIRRRERREARPAARLVMNELSEIQAILEADARREPEYRMGAVPRPTHWPTARQTLAAIVDGETWTTLNAAYTMAEYVTLKEEGELPTRALYGRAWLPEEISAAIYDAQCRLHRWADLPGNQKPTEPVGSTHVDTE